MSESAKCELCGEPMSPGEEMFKFHGYSGPCPKPPLRVTSAPLVTMSLSEQAQLVADTRQRVLAEVRKFIQREHDCIPPFYGGFARECVGRILAKLDALTADPTP